MKDVYMSIELGQLKSILESAIRLQKGDVRTPRTLMGLIEEYNRISSNSSIHNELPSISPFDDMTDIALLDGNLTGNGLSKLTKLISYSEGYINAHTPIPPIVVKGWSKKRFWSLTAIIITFCISVCCLTYQMGVSDGKSETQREYDAEKISLSKKNDSLKTEYNMIRESLKECNANTIAKDDSISFLLSKNKQVNNNKKGSAK